MSIIKNMLTRKSFAGRLVTAAAAVAVALVFLLAGYVIGRGAAGKTKKDNGVVGVDAVKSGTIWTCSMHPQIRMPEPGKCPICSMTLIPEKSGTNETLGPRMISMSEAAMKLAEVRTSPVQRRYVELEIPMVGLIAYDETRVKTIAAWTAGRLERMFVDYTGIAVNRGDHMVEIYSPDLFSAQEELLQALQALKKMRDSSSRMVVDSTRRTIEAARAKLRLLGLSRAQVSAIEKRGEALPTIQINSPVSGIVIHKNVEQGQYVRTGTPIYKVADLSVVWLRLDAYESDIAWLRYGQAVEVRTEAYGDRVFKGRISFIDPVLDPKTRSVKVRVNVDNRQGLLKPNMFVRARVKVRVGEKARVAGSGELAGKWICPMHPEVVADKAGKCGVCGMALRTAASLGLVGESDIGPGLVVPATAVLTTGERAIVYVRVQNRKTPTFQGVQIKVGPRAGHDYVVLGGLSEGMRVVTHGNFKIDSALQLQARPSMMNPEGGGPVPAGHAGHGSMKGMGNANRSDSAGGGDANAMNMKRAGGGKKVAGVKVAPAFIRQLSPLYAAYLDAHQALAADRESRARQALDKLAGMIDKVDMSLVKGHAHMQWMSVANELRLSLKHRAQAQGIGGVRKLFINVSKVIIRMASFFQHAGTGTYYVAFCSMADSGRGARWLQQSRKVRNPFYGKSMLSCGEIRMTLPGTGAANKGE